MAARRGPERPVPPRLSTPDLPDELEDVDGLRAHDDLVGARIAGLDGSVDAAHARLSESAVAEASVDRLSLVGAVLADVRIELLRAAELSGRSGRWRNVTIAGGRIGTLDLSGAELQSIEFRDVRIDYLSFAQATVEDMLLVDCTLRTVDAPQAELARVRFEGCRADEVDTRGLTARDVDLRGLEALAYTDPTALRGTTLSGRQTELLSGDLARALGIDVRD
jgi:uncharacterized protein YjbI with pentapeptide repeats